MNFQKGVVSFEKELANLLVVIVLFGKQIEDLKKKLAGNEQFHTRLAFHKIDRNRSSSIQPQDIIDFIQTHGRDGFTLENAKQFCRKHTLNGNIQYEQFLKLLVPNTNNGLAQRLLLRNPKRGAQVPTYLMNYLKQLMKCYLNLTKFTEIISKRIQETHSFTYLEIVQFFRKNLTSETLIFNFIHLNAGQYQFSLEDIKNISYQVKSRNLISQFQDQDIKQLICPLDMNFQKPHHYSPQQKYYQPNTRSQHPQLNTYFLKKTYTKNWVPSNQIHQNIPQNKYHQNYDSNYHQDPYQNREKIIKNQPKLYIDKFTKPTHAIELDAYLSRKGTQSRSKYIKQYERFDDNLPSSSRQSSGSAFESY